MRLTIPDMSCGHCKATIERTISEVDPAAQFEVRLEDKTAEITPSVPIEAITAALAKAGYPATAA